MYIYTRCWWFSRSVTSDSLQPCELWPARLLRLWDCPGKNTEVGCHFLLQGNFPHPGIEPTSLALSGRFFTTVPPGKPRKLSGGWEGHSECKVVWKPKWKRWKEVKWVRINDFVAVINTLNMMSSYPIHRINKVLQDQSHIKTLRDHEIPLLEAQCCLERGKGQGMSGDVG